MRHALTATAPLLLCAAAMGGGAPRRATPLPLMTAPAMLRPPHIDGRIQDGEWWRAAKATGFLNLIDGAAAEPQTVVYLAFDDQKLYVAFECAMTSERAPAAAESGRDGRVWSDDSFELLLLPPGREDAQFYHFIGNSIGAFYDAYARDKEWNGRWEYKATSGMGWWRGELSIPLPDLGAKELDGQTWRANFCRNAGKHTAWADTGRGYVNPARFGRVRFVRNTPVARIDSIEGLRAGRVRVKGMHLNAAPRQTWTLFAACITPADRTPPARWPILGEKTWRPTRQFNMGIGSHKEFAATLNAPSQARVHLNLGARLREGEQIFSQVIPFEAAGMEYAKVFGQPSGDTLYAQVNLCALAQHKSVNVSVHCASLRNGRVLESSERVKTGRVWTKAIDTRGLPPGKCRVNVRLAAAGRDKPIYETSIEYDLTPPEWYLEGRKIGVQPRVLKPWTPVEWDGRALAVWGRRHDFDASLFPSQITSAGRALLAKPIELSAVCNGEAVAATLLTRETLDRRGDRARTLAKGRMGELPVELQTTAEFDGMIWFELALRPKQTVKFEKLRLRVPMAKTCARYYHITNSYYGRGVSAAVPRAGLSDRFRPFVWLGGDAAGLMWFAEAPAGWRSDARPIHIKPGTNSTDLVVEFVNQPFTLNAPRRIAFGLQATPVKPLAADWRAWRVDSLYTGSRIKKHAIDWRALGVPLQWRVLWWTRGYRRVFSPGHTTPLQIMPDLSRYVQQAHDQGDRLVTYFYLHGVNRITTDFGRYYPVWQTARPKEMAYWGRVIMGACPGSTLGDMLLYGIRRMAREHGIDGVYFDGAGPPIACSNAFHGHGWTDDEGRRRYSYPILGLRRFYKRLATMLQDELERPIIWVHADGKMPTPCFSFATANWEGEMVQGQLKREGSVLSDLISPAFCRGHLVATPWGVPTLWLPSAFGSPANRKRQARDCMALLLVHGAPFARVPSFDRGLIEAVWRAQAEFGISKAQFRGYWEAASRLRVAPAHERVLASYFERGGKRLIAVGNFTDQAREVKLSFTDARAQSARDAIAGDAIAVRDGALSVEVGGRASRLVEVSVN